MELSNLTSPIGLVAGNGQFPLEFVECARARGLDVVLVAHRGETDPTLESKVAKILWVNVGQLGKIIKFFKKQGVKQAAFVGGITKLRLFSNVRLDLKGIMTLARIRTFNDDALLRGISGAIEKSGVEIFAPSELLEKSVVRKGVLTKRGLTAKEVEDAIIGWESAEGIGKFDIGQTVVIKKKGVVAVEGVEGTDACISRAGALVGDGCLVVKLPKPEQDIRFDMPAIGEGTVNAMQAVNATALILKADFALIMNPLEVIKKADAAGIAIAAFNNKDEIIS